LTFWGAGAVVFHAAEATFETIDTSTEDGNASSNHTLVTGPDGFPDESDRTNYGQGFDTVAGYARFGTESYAASSQTTRISRVEPSIVWLFLYLI